MTEKMRKHEIRVVRTNLPPDEAYSVNEIGSRRAADGVMESRSRYESIELEENEHRIKEVDDVIDIVLTVECTDGYFINCYADGTWEIWHDTSSVGHEMIAISKGQDVLPGCMINSPYGDSE